MAVDRICEKYNLTLNKSKFDSKYTKSVIENNDVIIMKPQTFMNLSGAAVEKMAAFYKVPPEHIIIIFDDISLDVGKMRIRPKGSAGGHNGIKNIIDMLSSDAFPRIKIGIGKKPASIPDLKDFVLSRFKSDELEILSDVLDKAAEAAVCIMNKPIEYAQNKFN